MVSAHIVTGEAELFAASSRGQIIRTKLATIRETGRAAQGVRIMKVAAGRFHSRHYLYLAYRRYNI